jgi:hypothetical protein
VNRTWDEVQAGDDLMFPGTPHRITRIEPYTDPVVTRGETWAIACADTPSASGKAARGITLSPGGAYEVAGRPAPPTCSRRHG